MALLGRVLLALSLVLVVSACGDDVDTSDDPVSGDVGVGEEPDVDEAPELQRAVDSYARAVISGDPEAAVELHSAACADVNVAEPPGGTGADAPDARASNYVAEIDGDRATVSYRYDVPTTFEVEDERWVRENGEWKWDNC